MSKTKSAVGYLCAGILVILMLTVFVRLVTRIVLINALGIDNKFTETVFFDHSFLQIPKETESTTGINLSAQYPFTDNADTTASSSHVTVTPPSQKST